MKAKAYPSLDYLNECFEVSESSPSGLVWKIRPRHHFLTNRSWNYVNNRFANTHAGHFNDKPKIGLDYYYVGVSCKVYLAHRIVYMLHNNEVLGLTEQVDHTDGNTSNNNPSNLRKASHSNNIHNQAIRKNNTSGFKGVSWCKVMKAWRYCVMIERVRHRGYAPTAERAYDIACELRKILHKEFSRN